MTLDDYESVDRRTGELNPIVGYDLYMCISKSRDRFIPSYGGYTFQPHDRKMRLPLMRNGEHIWTVKLFYTLNGNLYWGRWASVEAVIEDAP